jgi:hypothetical protein
MSKSPPPSLLDDEIREMLRAFEGPESPQPRTTTSRLRARRALMAGTAAAIALGAVVLAVWSLAGEGERREAALSRTESCSELRLGGRRYLARRVSPELLAPAGALRRPAVALCRGSNVRGARVVRLAGIDPAAVLARAAVPGVVYVAANSGCLGARGEADLVSCLRRVGAPR